MKLRRWRFGAAAGVLISAAAIAPPALCDPCEAIPTKGPMPAYLHHGATFSGPVVYVGDQRLHAKTIRRKIEEGVWIENRHYRRVPDSRVLIDVEGFKAWVEG